MKNTNISLFKVHPLIAEAAMARADLLTSLVKFGVSGDKARFRKVAETIIAEERAKQHTVLADTTEE